MLTSFVHLGLRVKSANVRPAIRRVKLMARPRGKSENQNEQMMNSSYRKRRRAGKSARTRAEAKEQGKKYFQWQALQQKRAFQPQLTSNYSCCACDYVKANSPETKQYQSEYARQNRETILAKVKERRADPMTHSLKKNQQDLKNTERKILN